MDAPRCIVCNTNHWSRQPCPAMGGVYDQRALKQARLEVAREALRAAETVTETRPVKQEQVRQLDTAVRQNTPVKQPAVRQETAPVKQATTDRKAYLRDYMRDYMRQRRGAQKAAKQADPPLTTPSS